MFVWLFYLWYSDLWRVMSNLKIILSNPRPVNEIKNKVHQIISYKCQHIYLSWKRHRFHFVQVSAKYTCFCYPFIWLEFCSLISRPNPFRVSSLISKFFDWLKTLDVFICFCGFIVRSGGCQFFFSVED